MRIKYQLLMSQHPNNHYGRMTLRVGDREVTAYLRNDSAHEISSLVRHAYELGRKDALIDVQHRLAAMQ